LDKILELNNDLLEINNSVILFLEDEMEIKEEVKNKII
jgi:hypothetical protein